VSLGKTINAIPYLEAKQPTCGGAQPSNRPANKTIRSGKRNTEHNGTCKKKDQKYFIT